MFGFISRIGLLWSGTSVVPKVPKVTLEETIGGSALRANASIISRTNSGSSISPSTTKVYKSTLLLLFEGQFIEVGGSAT